MSFERTAQALWNGTAFGDDLERFLHGRPVLARPVGSIAKTWRWTKRKPGIAILLALSFVLLLSGTVISTHFAIEASHRAEAEIAERQRADREAEAARAAERQTSQALMEEAKARGEADAQRRFADEMRFLAEARFDERTRSLYALQLTRAHSIWRDPQGEAVDLLADEVGCPPELRDFTWRYLEHLTDRRIERWQVASTRVNPLDVSPDGSRVAAAGLGKTVSVWRPGHSEPVVKLEHKAKRIGAGSFSQDGKRLATGVGKSVIIWNVDNGEAERRLDHGASAKSVVYSPDGRVLISAGGGIVIWDANSGAMIRRLGESTQKISHMVLAADSKRLLTAEARCW